MQSANTGKIIKKIKFNKKGIVLSFNDKTKIEISEEAYASIYLYVGKELDDKSLQELQEITELAKHLNYALSILRRGHYSEHTMREKLYNREATKPQVDKVITMLKNASLIDDAMYAYDLQEWENEKLHGKNRIIKFLRDKGIFEKEISKLSFPKSNEIRKAKDNLPKLEARYEKYSYESKKQHIYAALINLGFDSDVAMEVLSKVKPANDKQEKEKLKRDYEKIYRKYSSKYEGRELREKIIASLRNKGYRFGDILKIMEESKYGKDDFGIC